MSGASDARHARMSRKLAIMEEHRQSLLAALAGPDAPKAIADRMAMVEASRLATLAALTAEAGS